MIWTKWQKLGSFSLKVLKLKSWKLHNCTDFNLRVSFQPIFRRLFTPTWITLRKISILNFSQKISILNFSQKISILLNTQRSLFCLIDRFILPLLLDLAINVPYHSPHLSTGVNPQRGSSYVANRSSPYKKQPGENSSWLSVRYWRPLNMLSIPPEVVWALQHAYCDTGIR